MKRVVLVLLLTGAVAGCGTQSQPSSADKFKNPDQKVIAQKVEDLENAGRRGKADDICSDILARQPKIKDVYRLGLQLKGK